MSDAVLASLYTIRPELLLTFYAFFMLLLAVFPVFKRYLGGLAALGCVLTLGVVLSYHYQQGFAGLQGGTRLFFSNLVVLDGFGLFLPPTRRRWALPVDWTASPGRRACRTCSISVRDSFTGASPFCCRAQLVFARCIWRSMGCHAGVPSRSGINRLALARRYHKTRSRNRHPNRSAAPLPLP